MKRTLSLILTIGLLIGLMSAPVFAFKSDNKQSNSTYINKAPHKAKPQEVKDASLELQNSIQIVKSHFAIAAREIQKKSNNAKQIEKKSISSGSKNLEKPKTKSLNSILLTNHPFQRQNR